MFMHFFFFYVVSYELHKILIKINLEPDQSLLFRCYSDEVERGMNLFSGCKMSILGLGDIMND